MKLNEELNKYFFFLRRHNSSESQLRVICSATKAKIGVIVGLKMMDEPIRPPMAK